MLVVPDLVSRRYRKRHRRAPLLRMIKMLTWSTWLFLNPLALDSEPHLRHRCQHSGQRLPRVSELSLPLHRNASLVPTTLHCFLAGGHPMPARQPVSVGQA